MYLQTWTTSGSEVNTKSKETVFQVKSPIMVQHGEKRIHLWLSLYKHIISCYVKQIILYYFTLNFLYNHLFNVILTFKIDCKYIIRGESELEILENNPNVREAYIKTISNAGPIMILSTIMIISFFILIGTPIYRKVRRKIYYKIEVNNRYERTKEGEILVEQIAGIKNYIHDFSLLSEKDKENIALWEDFLIYAVVLEENETIINNIYSYRNINSNILNNIKRIIDVSKI